MSNIRGAGGQRNDSKFNNSPLYLEPSLNSTPLSLNSGNYYHNIINANNQVHDECLAPSKTVLNIVKGQINNLEKQKLVH